MDVIKQKLKAWEREFERGNGRKATAADVKSGPVEIQALYREYAALKRHGSSPAGPSPGHRTTPLRTTPLEERKEEEDGVFGKALNKPKNGKVLVPRRRREMKSIWRQPSLLAYTKLRRPGVKVTAVQPLRHAVSQLASTSLPGSPHMETNQNDPSDQPTTSSGPSLRTSPLVPSLDVPIFSGPKVTAGQCQTKPLGEEKAPCVFRHVSKAWLDRCRPDLNSVMDDTTLAHSKGPSPKMVASGVSGEGLLTNLEKQWTATKRDLEPSAASVSGEGLLAKREEQWRATKRDLEPSAASVSGEGFLVKREEQWTATKRDLEPSALSVDRSRGEELLARASHVEAGRKVTKKGMEDSAYHASCGGLIARVSHVERVDGMEPGLSDRRASGQRVASGDEDDGMEPGPGVSELGVENAGMELGHRVSESRQQSDEEMEVLSQAALSSSKQGGKRQKPASEGPPPARGKAVSENFVRLNMKVKRYSKRPGRTLTGSAYKRKEWKKRQKGEEGKSKGVGRFVCFKCGKTGHWARNCQDRGGSSNLGSFSGQQVEFSESVGLGMEDDVDDITLEMLEKECPFPSISEAARMAAGKGADHSEDNTTFIPPPPNHSPPPSLPTVEPLYSTEDGRVTATPTSVFAGLKKLGFTEFRPRQESAIVRVLSGVSTLLITTTGSGKSLCYQLPALLYAQARHPCITLVISPLLSLMDDQVRQFPTGLKGACLHTNQTHPQMERVLREVAEGLVDVLLLSPEALVGGTLWNRKRHAHSLHDLPPVAFACIDEAHCISEWSHNFRPSYLRLYKVLQERLGVRCVLGLTATATHVTELSIARHLGVVEENILRGSALPDNLHITVSCDQDRDQALVELLSKEPFKSLSSLIIYCTRQQTTDTLAQMLRTCMQSWHGVSEESLSQPATTSRGYKKRAKAVHAAECYHAGMAAAQRRSVQNKFMSGSLRIVVATVAFGMGLNKRDVRAIIHYNMPKSFESFVQEIGRAGRDGEPAYCHVFIDKEASDLFELRRHAYSNSVDRYAVKKLVEQAFPVCQCGRVPLEEQEASMTPVFSGNMAPRICRGHEVAIPVEAVVQSLDAKEECLSTLLCYLELEGWLRIKQHTYDTCTLQCCGGKRQLRALARKVPAVAAAAACLRGKGVHLEESNHMTFSVIEVANSMGWESHVVRSELMALRFSDHGTGSAPKSVRSTVMVEIEELAFHLVSPGDLSAEEREALIQMLNSKVAEQEKREVEKLHLLHAVLKSLAMETHDVAVRVNDIGVARNEEVIGTQSPDVSLKDTIEQYFSTEGLSIEGLRQRGISVSAHSPQLSQEEDLIGRDIATMVTRFSDQTFTGRAIARILHGIPSPRFPALVWGAQRGFWRRYLQVDFNTLTNLATTLLLQQK